MSAEPEVAQLGGYWTSRPGNSEVAARISAGSERRALARARCKFGNSFGADGVNGATQFLDTAAEPLQINLSDAVVF